MASQFAQLTTPKRNPKTGQTDIQEAVAYQAARLDEVKPGWADEINLKKLDLGISTRCIYGQQFGSYNNGVFEMFQAFGSTLSGGSTDWMGAFTDTPEADHFWRNEILQRTT